MAANFVFSRKLRAIAVVDVVGYARLMAHSEAATHARVNQLFAAVVEPLIVSCSGQMIERAGDGLLILFESSTDAVRCAVAIQRAAALHERDTSTSPNLRLKLRIGINVGDIIIDGTEIAGDDVNIAVRLQSIAKPGGICISDAVKQQLHEDLDASFADMGEVDLKHIGRPIHAYELRLDGTPAGITRAAGNFLRSRFRSHRKSMIAALALAVTAVGLVTWLVRRETTAMRAPPPMSVGVIPIDARGDANSMALAASTTDNLTRALTSTSWLHVAAPDSAAKGGDYRDIGRKLHVRYLVVSSMETPGTTARLNLALIDTAQGLTIWSTQLERPRSGNPGLALSANAAVQLRDAIYDAEWKSLMESGRSPATAMEFKMMGDSMTDPHFVTIETDRKARAFYEKGLAVDRNFVPDIMAVAYTLLTELNLDPEADRGQIVQQVDEYSKRAITLDPGSAPAWQLRAEALAAQQRWDAAFEASDKSLALDPGRAYALGERARLLVLTGKPDEALRAVSKASELARQRYGYVMFQRCRAELALGRIQASIVSCQKSLSDEEWWLQHVYLLSAYALAGDAANVDIERAIVARLRPGLTSTQVKSVDASNVPAYEKQAEETLFRGLRMAGMRSAP